jgi:hypothetical protein
LFIGRYEDFMIAEIQNIKETITELFNTLTSVGIAGKYIVSATIDIIEAALKSEENIEKVIFSYFFLIFMYQRRILCTFYGAVDF